MARGDTTLEAKQRWMRERYAVHGAAPYASPPSSSLAEGLYAERHYSVSEVAALWHLSQDAVRKLFQIEPGVLVLGGTGSLHKRRYTTCPHRAQGRKYRRCRCPLWVDGFLQGVELRESLNLKDWDKAQDRIREWEARGMVVAEEEPPLSLSEAQERFRADAQARGLRPATLVKYRGLFTQMQAFAREEGRPFLEQWTLEALRRFRQSWKDGGMSALKKLERLRAFFRFAHESKWIDENPTKAIKNPKVTTPPTLPFAQEEMIAILAACGRYPDNYGKLDQINAQRLKVLVLLLRYSGMRIGDAVTCAQDRLTGDRLFLYTQKTGVPVRVKLPAFVAQILQSLASVSQQYFFWTGEGTPQTAAGNWRRGFAKLFKLASIEGGHPHRFRDTFATELLLAGVPLEPVSVLLGHSSIRVATLKIHEEPFDMTDGNCLGYANRDRQIAISPMAPLPHKTLFHEVAHVVLGHVTEGSFTDQESTPRSLREVEAEGVALICCESLGLPGADFARGYIQHWLEGDRIPEKSAQRIIQVADQILKAGVKNCEAHRPQSPRPGTRLRRAFDEAAAAR